MNKAIIIAAIGIVVLIMGIFYFRSKEIGYKSISSKELSLMLEGEKDFTLIDVHTPQQQHIPKTDFMISYDEVDKITSVIPNKNSKVVFYCRSGSMSKILSEELIKEGYTNVFELENGLNGWLSENREVLPKGSVKII